MSQQELLTAVVAVLKRLGIEFLVTGSIASSLQGVPRSTHDIDLLVRLRLGDVPDLLAAFPPPDFYLSESAVRDAVRSASMFNLLHIPTGDKVDFWIESDSPFDRSRFSRRLLKTFERTQLPVSSPEDTVLAKLQWAKKCGGSEKQVADVQGILEVQGSSLDRTYVDHWARLLGVSDRWEELKARLLPESD